MRSPSPVSESLPLAPISKFSVVVEDIQVPDRFKQLGNKKETDIEAFIQTHLKVLIFKSAKLNW